MLSLESKTGSNRDSVVRESSKRRHLLHGAKRNEVTGVRSTRILGSPEWITEYSYGVDYL